MAAYSVLFRESVKRDIAPIPSKDLKRILERIGALADNPRPLGCEKLTAQARYRIRQGNYRIIYSIQDTQLTIWIIKIGHRRGVYRR